MPLLPPFPNAFTWRLMAGFGALALVLGVMQGFTLHRNALIVAALVLPTMLVIAHVYTFRRPEPQFAYPAALLSYFVVTGIVFGPLSYLTASLNMPLVDAELAAIDPYLGFDWLALYKFTAAHPALGKVARIAYSNTGIGLIIAWGVLCATGQIERLSIFLTAFALAAGTTVVLAGLFPAVGAYPYYGLGAAAGFGTDGPGMSYVADFNNLRAGNLRLVDLSNADGLCQFPSFHTVVALFCGWAVAKTRWLKWPGAAWAAFVVYTTMPIGGHHLADVLGGTVLAYVSLVIAIRVEARAKQPASSSRELADCAGAVAAKA